MILPRSLPWHRPLRSLLPLAALPFLGGCNMVVLNPAGDVARQQADVLMISVGLMLLIIIPVMALTVWFAWKYRATNEKATYKPDWDHSTALELVIWSGPLLIVIALGALTWISTHLLDPYRPIVSPGTAGDHRTVLVEGPKFVLERWTGGEHPVTLPEGLTAWIVPIKGSGEVAGVPFKAGECVTVTGSETIVAGDDADYLFAYPGTRRL